MPIGIIVEAHHTEHLQVVLEILKELNENVIIYNSVDTYGNMESLKSKFDFEKRSLETLYRDYPYVCSHYIVMSNTLDFYKVFEPAKHMRIIYIAHVHSERKQLELVKDIKMFSLSKSVLGESKFIMSIPKIPSIDIQLTNDTQVLNVVKLGWVVSDKDGYIRLLGTGKIHLHVFSIAMTPILFSLMEEYPKYITIYIKRSSDFINKYITKNNIKLFRQINIVSV